MESEEHKFHSVVCFVKSDLR